MLDKAGAGPGMHIREGKRIQLKYTGRAFRVSLLVNPAYCLSA